MLLIANRYYGYCHGSSLLTKVFGVKQQGTIIGTQMRSVPDDERRRKL